MVAINKTIITTIQAYVVKATDIKNEYLRCYAKNLINNLETL